ncbi:uncharacterized protein LOC142979024 [Anticarsia gemmatalis]|uniref:uncharacterized protein LOC142979024 n=1 Tax=Anticarsia gemmatalis TaxID=129554 RepID=UPI003F76131B
MNELLQKHGCANVFTVPEGLKELMSDITREVLRAQPKRLLDFIANYLSALLITREHGIMAVKILDELCDCRPSVSEHLLQLGLERGPAAELSEIIKAEIETTEPVEGREKVKEYMILKKILARIPLDEDMSAKVCQVARNAYRDYWYRKDLLKKGIKMQQEEPWEIAARHTLELYKRTKPSFTELNRATQKIQAAYKGYHVRRKILSHLLPKKDKMQGRKADLSGPPLDIAVSREIDLGPVINIRDTVTEDNVSEMFENEKTAALGLPYDPMKMITHVDDDMFLEERADKTGAKKGVKLIGPGPEVRSQSTAPPSDKGSVKVEDSATNTTFNRISFSTVPATVIDDDYAEVPEERGQQTGRGLAAAIEEAPEVPEEILTELPGDNIVDADEVTDSVGISYPDADPTDVEDNEEEEEEE